jgi:hypothetical protein
MINQFASSKPKKVAEEWQEFFASSPQSDDAQEYVANHPDVPFCDIMFGATGVSGETVDPRRARRQRWTQRQRWTRRRRCCGCRGHC